ncbi:MAG: helix-turn-helix transcriptional regulator [Candidatus Izemoplasmatales bacterium]|nr:helix-turn-helix transcriptional regulator [Candidatus Izemoplasmatales bacterium]
MEYIAKKIQELRLKHNLSQGDLAEKLGVSRQAIRKWEREERLPDLYNIKRLAEIFKVSVDELVMDSGNIIIDYRNKTSVVLMSIPMGFISLGILILLFFTVAYGVVITGDIFTMARMVLYNNLQFVFVPVGLLISIILIQTFVNLLSNHKVSLSKLLTIILYSLILAIFLGALLAFEISGFSTIFLYVVGFIIIVVGLVGAILFQKDIYMHTGIREKKPIRISLNVLKAIMLSYILIFSLSAIQTYIFTKPLYYLYDYASNSEDNSYNMDVYQDESNSDLRHFHINITYLVEIDQEVQTPYVKVYMLDTVIAEGNLSKSINGDFNYQFEFIQDDYELPLILTDYEFSKPIEIKCVVSYDLNGIHQTNTIFPEFRQNRIVVGLVNPKNLWIWDYKNYVPEI